MRQVFKESDFIATVADMRKALEGEPDDRPLVDALGEPIVLIWVDEGRGVEIEMR